MYHKPSLMVIKRFLVQKHLCPDLEAAGKQLERDLGRDLTCIEYPQFYKLFCKGIFRVALQDMLKTVQEFAEKGGKMSDLPLFI